MKLHNVHLLNHDQSISIKILRSVGLAIAWIAAFSSVNAAIVYQHNFGAVAISGKPYTVAPTTLDANINSGSQWDTSVSGFTSFAGSSGQALSLSSSAGTPTYTLTFTVASGYQFSLSTFSFWRQRSAAGAQNWSMTVNGTAVGSGTVPTTGANTGNLTPSNPILNLSGTITIVLSLSGASGAGTFRLDDFTLDGTVSSALAAEPTTQATSVSFSSVLTTQMGVSWTSGNGANRLVICRQGSAPSSGPVDTTSYTADASFSGSGSSLGGGKVVYAGSGSSFTLTGLSPSTTYYLQVYEYNGSAATANYLTSTASGNPNNQTTATPANSTDSDIIRASAFTEPTDVAYSSYQATDITSGNSIELARFTLRDGGASSDSDSAATTLDEISFTVSNSDSLRRVALYDGSTEIAEVAGGASLTFSALSGLVAADGSTKDFSIRATFLATVTDNQQIQFTVNSATANAGGSIFASANAGAAASSTTGDRNRIEVTATKLVFTSTPSSVNIVQSFTASVAARDANENLDVDNTASVTITKASGSGTLSGGSAQSLVSGAQSFSSLQIDSSGTFTLQAAGGGLAVATSGSIIALGRPLAISGYFANPAGNDGPYEYVQVIALEDVDFSVTPMSMVWANNGTATANGWAQGSSISYKFNITSGSMSEGDVAYVGGSGKLINGVGTTDISGQNWLRAINTSTTAGDDFGTSSGTSGNMGQGGTGDGIAIFNGTTITDTTVPVDAIFYGTSMPVVSGGADGYVLPVNDLYSGGFVQTGSAKFGDPVSGGFAKLSGTFNTITKTWTTARTLSTVSSPSAVGDIATGIIVTAPASEPTTQASSILFANVQDDQIDVSWTSGNGANRLVIARQGSAPSGGPVDATTYTADADFTGAGSSLGSGKVVYIGSGNSFTLTGLSASTTYHLQVYEYNGTGVNANYLTSSASGNPNSQISADPPNSSLSDIVRASGFTEPANIAYGSYQATDITDANSIELARFTLRDGGGSSDADAFSTTLDAITLSVANHANLRRVALYDGTTEIAEVAGGASLVFSGLSGLVAADNGTKNFSVRATFAAGVNDNQQIQFTVSSASALVGASLFASANAGGAASDITGDANRIEVTATKLVFSTVPGTVTIAQNFTAVVQARDANENVDADNTASVTVIKGSGSGVLTGGDAQNLVSGVRSFTSLQMDTTGSFTLQASGGSLSTAASGSISALPGPTTLAAGDIAVIGYNTAGTPDNFAILVLRELGPGTVFYINDNEVTSAGGTAFADLAEVEASFTVKADQIIPAGTIIILPWGAAAVSTATYDWSSTTGAGFGSNNEEIYIYTAANISATTPTAFIFGTRIGTSSSARPNGLTAGTTWITPPPSGTAAASRYKITGALYTATTNAILTAIGDVPNNWETAASYTLSDTDWTFTFQTPASQPTVQASDITFDLVNAIDIDLSWTSGNGANRLVICREGSAPNAVPVDGTAYTADAEFSGSGSSLGGGKVVYIGSDNTFSLFGLTPSTSYHIQIFEFNGTDTTINYLTSTASGNPNSTTTDSAGNSTDSDIARSASFTEPDNIDYAAYQNTDVEFASSIEVARFTIRDGGGATDADALVTTLDAITFTVANGASLRRVALYDGATEIAEVAGGTSVSFSSLTGLTAADGSTKDFSIRATFVTSVTDNQQIQFTVSSATAAVGLSSFAVANAGAASSSITGDRNRLEVTATKLVFSSVPASASVAANFSVSVQARDANERVDLDNTDSVTITKASGSGTLSGGGAQSLVSGAQTWASLSVDTSGSVTLEATGGILTPATSSSITIANLLSAGDAAFVAWNADGNDDFAIVFFKDVDAGTELYFNDNAWNGSAFAATEGSFLWNSGVSLITSGTVVRFSSLGTGGRAASVGTISGYTGSFNLGGSGDGLFCYRGSAVSSPSAFLAAIGNDSLAGSFGSISGTGLTDGDTAIRLTSGTDIGQYSGARDGYMSTGYRALLNSMSNWDLQDGSGDQSSDGISPDVPFSTTSFTFSSLAVQPTTQASGINFSTVQSAQMNIAWTSGNGANRLVICRASATPSSGPVDATTYTADSVFSGSGSALGGGKVVYIGSGSSFTLTGLDPATTYYLQVYEYNGSAGTINYLTTTAAGNPNSQATTASGLSTESDIIRATGFTEPTDVDYASYQATDITFGNSIELARFTMRDGSGAADVDVQDTTLSTLSFSIVNGTRLRRVALYDGSTEIAEVAGGTTASFSSLSSLVALDDGTKDISVRATFTASVTDNQQLQFTVANATASLSGSTFASIDAGGASSEISGNANRIEVMASKLVFSAVQSPVLVNEAFTATVQARDANENVDLDNTASVTITKAMGSGTLSGGSAQNLISGEGLWTGLAIDSAGTFTLQAVDGVLTATTSSSITATQPLAAGDLAIIGRINNTSPDSFAIVALAEIPAGSVVYFTDNAWSNTSPSAFRGSALDGDGNETLTRLTFNSAISPGTIIRTLDTADVRWTWTTSGAITFGGSATYGSLQLAGGGDQIYAFQAATLVTNPLGSVSSHIFVFDDTHGFEDPDNSSGSAQGNVTPGLSSNANTAISFDMSANSVVGLNMNLAGAENFDTKAEWLEFIADEANWTTSATGLPSGGIGFDLACPGSVPPRMSNPGSRTFTVGSLSTFSIVANDPGCQGVTITAYGVPSGANFSSSFNGTNTVGTFSWNPNNGQEDTYLVRFAATDSSAIESNFVIRLYVRAIGETTNSAGVPLSQTNWSVAITDIPANSSLTWDATVGIPYNVYYSDSDPSGAMSWVLVGQTTASTENESLTVPEDNRRYYKVVPVGETPTSDGIWGVIKPTVVSGYSMMSAPLDIADRSFDGELGQALAEALDSSAATIYVMNANGSWRVIQLDGDTWEEEGVPSTFELAEGQGFYVENVGSSATPRFAGPVGNTGAATLSINPGPSSSSGRWNIIGLSQGKTRTFAQTFASANFVGSPTANWDEAVSDLVVVLNPDGSWRRVMRAGDGTWLDISTVPFSTPNFSLEPGSAVYYFRYGNASLSVKF